MKKILVISWFYPPVNSSEGLVTYKLLKNSKLEYDVFTQKNNKLWSYGNEDYLPDSDNVNCIYSSSLNLKDWVYDAINYYQQNIDKYDVVMTRSMPEEAHEVGLAIKKLNPNIKWIASFGDPIANNPYTIKSIKRENVYSLDQRYKRKMSMREIFSIKRIVKSMNFKRISKKCFTVHVKNKNKLQNKIILLSDKIICNSTYQADYMLDKYEKNIKDKVIVLPHSYDKKLYPNKKKKKNDKLHFVYIGHLDNIRTPRLLLEAIKILNNTYDDFKEKVEFNFYGNLSSKDKLYILDNELSNIVKIKKSVSYISSLQIMKEANWLVHIDANISDVIYENIFFAAKIADYIGSKSNILGITMLNGASADILRENNSLIISHSIDEIKNYLYLIVYENYNIKQSKDNYELYDAISVAKKFDNEINKILE